MKRAIIATSLLLAGCFSVWASGPNDRKPTDPKSIISPVSEQTRPVPLADLLSTKKVGDPAWSPDGKQIVFAANFTGRRNLWKVNSNGGWPIQLTHSEERQGGPRFSPDGQWILYTQDRGGNEYYDIYRIPSGGGEPENLTGTNDVSETSPMFSPDRLSLALDYKQRTSPTTDIAIMDWNSRNIRKLTNETDGRYRWAVAGWSPDGKYIYANRIRGWTFDEASVYRLDVKTGRAEELTPHKGDQMNTLSDISPDGKTLLITSSRPDGIEGVALLDVATRQRTWITEPGWGAWAGDFSPDGRYFTYGRNQAGQVPVFIYDRTTRKSVPVAIPNGITYPVGAPRGFAPLGDRILLHHEDSQHPTDLWIYDVALGKATQLTHSALASVAPEVLPPSGLVHYKSFDGTIISAFLWVPFNLKRDGTAPAIVLAHGGPTGAWGDEFNTLAAALASRGYLCIAPNVRGSIGFGIEFQKANYKDLGGGDLKDVEYAAKFMIDTGFADAKKLGITGHSYGGFMTLMAIAKNPEMWKAAVEEFGIVSYVSMMKHADPFLQEYTKAFLGDPEKDRETYENASPLKYLRNAKAPLLVLHGENDIRVPKEEAEQVVDVLKKENKVVEAIYYAEEGHGFTRPETQIDSLRRTVEWFDKYLKGSPAGAGPN